jgi:AcrR family transcriptional regulator
LIAPGPYRHQAATVTEIARRAGVGRVTVYNHFPDDVALLGACSAHFVAGHPPPDPGAWATISDAEAVEVMVGAVGVAAGRTSTAAG